MITCRDMIEFLAAYLDEELPEADRAAFEQHIAGCGACRDYLRTYRDAIAMARGLSDEALCDEAPEDLVKAILASRSAGDAGPPNTPRSTDPHSGPTNA